MRRPLIILGSFVAVGAMFGVYMLLLPPTIRITPTGGGPNSVTARDRQANESGGVIGPGQGIWVSQYDDQMRLVSQFRASDMLPKAEGIVEALFPEARIPLSGGQVIHLSADRGEMVVKEMPQTSGTRLGGPMPSMPRRGKMQNVRVNIEDGTGRIVLAATVNNVAFDFDTFRIFTQAYKNDAGAEVPGDRVKVEVRGDDVDFDGYGLTLRWDDKNGVIRLLEISHGEQLTIKRSQSVGGLSLAPLPVRRERLGEGDQIVSSAEFRVPSEVSPFAASIHSALGTRHSPLPIQLASTDPAAFTLAMPATTQTTAAEKRLTPYRAKLVDNVRIEQDGQTLAAGDALTIDFVGESTTQPDASAPTLQPATAAAPIAAAPVVTTAPVTTAPVNPPAAAAVPENKPADKPMVVKWNGSLRIVPLEKEQPLAAIAPGDAVAELSGKVVTLKQAGATVNVGSVLYRTIDGGATLTAPTGKSHISLTDEAGRTVTTESIDYNGQTKIATLNGSGTLNVPATEETNNEPLAAKWAKQARITLSDSATTDANATGQSLSRIDCVGDVKIDHPRLAMASETLSLQFSPGKASNQPVLKSVIAAGGVKAVTTDVDDKGAKATRTIESEKVTMTTGVDAKGQPIPERFIATGKVHAYDDAGQNLYADNLDAVLGSVTAEKDAAASIALKELIADGNVKVTGSDDTSAIADRLRITTVANDKTIVELTDEKNNVRIKAQDSDIVAPLVRVDTSTGVATVTGAGTIRTVSGEGDAKRPVTITWLKEAQLNSSANNVTVTGDVKVVSTAPDGSTQTATAKRVVVTLADRLKAAAEAKKPTPETDSPLTGLTGNAGAFGDKEPVAVTLFEDVNITSVETLQGQPVRQFLLRSAEVRYDLKTEQLTVPGPGDALYDDVRPAAAQGGDTNQARGAVAMGWQKSLVASQKTNKVRVEGEVVVKHQPAAPEGVPLDLKASAIDVELEPASGKPTTASSQPAAVPGVKQVVASAPILFTTDRGTFDAQKLTFDTASGFVTASGAPGSPVQVLGTGGTLSGTATQVRYNITTNLVDMTDFVATLRK